MLRLLRQLAQEQGMVSPPIHYFKFDNDLTDSGTNGDDLTSFGTSSIGFGTGKINESTVWTSDLQERATGDGLNFYNGNPTQDSPFSLNFWVKSNGQSSPQIICARRFGGANDQFQLSFDNDKITFSLYGSTVSNNLSVTSTSLSVSTWYNISITYDGSSLASGISMKVNDGSAIGGIETGTYTFNHDASPLIFGLLNTNFAFVGELDLFRVYDRVITAEEETYLYNSGSGRA